MTKRFKKVVEYNEGYFWLPSFFISLIISYLFGILFAEEMKIEMLFFPTLICIVWFLFWVAFRKVYYEQEKKQ